jgi:hypothetical protein
MEVRTLPELRAKKRATVPTKKFGLPERARSSDAKKETGNYPMPDRRHAANAKARAKQQLEKEEAESRPLRQDRLEGGSHPEGIERLRDRRQRYVSVVVGIVRRSCTGESWGWRCSASAGIS